MSLSHYEKAESCGIMSTINDWVCFLSDTWHVWALRTEQTALSELRASLMHADVLAHRRVCVLSAFTQRRKREDGEKIKIFRNSPIFLKEENVKEPALVQTVIRSSRQPLGSGVSLRWKHSFSVTCMSGSGACWWVDEEAKEKGWKSKKGTNLR